MSKIALRSECAVNSAFASEQCATLDWINSYAVNQVNGNYDNNQCVTLDDLGSVGYATRLISVGSNNSGVVGYVEDGKLYIRASNPQSGSGYLFPKFSITPIINEYSRPSGSGVNDIFTSQPAVTTNFGSATLSIEYGGSSGSYPDVTLSGDEYHCSCPIKLTWSTIIPTSPHLAGTLTITWANYYFSFAPANGPSITSPSALVCSCKVLRGQ